MNLTKVLLPITVTFTVLLTVNMIGTAFTLAWALTIVSFSLQVAFTTLVKSPTPTIFIVMLNLNDSPGLINGTTNKPVLLL